MTWRGIEARNETRFRDQNEWIEDVSASFGFERLMVFVCECGDGNCSEPIELTRAEYEAVRATSNRFAIAIDHENPESEVVVRECERFAVVDKVEGVAMRIARDTDPRSSAHPPPRDTRIEETSDEHH